MRARIFILIIVLSLLLSSCTGGAGEEVSSRVATLAAQALMATLPATAVVLPTQTIPAPTPTTTNTPAPEARLTITAIQETTPGRVIISWDAIGEFPYGYNVVWTTEQRNPEVPGDTYVFTADPYARSAMISGSVGQVYLVRVCRVMNGGCDIYSDLGIFTYSQKAITTSTSYPVASTFVTPDGGGGGATLTPAPTLAITGISAAAGNKARITWSSASDPNKGFAILYSATDKEPAWGKNAFYMISDGKIREAYVDGKAGKAYYFRICTLKSGACDVYSNSVSFTFP